MSTPVFYFYGGEDLDWTQVVPVGMSFITTAGYFRSGYARQAMLTANNPGSYWQSARPFAQNTFWQSAQTAVNQNTPSTNYIHWGLADAAQLPRLEIRGITSTGYALYKVNSVGALTQLGSTFNVPYSGTQTNQQKWDVFVNYGTSGTITFYMDYVQFFTYSGDLTTDGNTSLSYLMLGCAPAGNSGVSTVWSEAIVSDSDTRGMSGLVTLPPVANGNTHNFDLGTPAASNVNKLLINDATFDGASAVGLIDQYTIPGLPAGAWQIASVGIVARAESAAFGSPSQIEEGVRSNGGDYWGSALPAPPLAYSNTLATTWEIDPSTGVTWAALPDNIGIKAA